MLDLIADGTISGKIAKDLFEMVWSEGGDPRAIVEARGMKQVTDLGAIEKTVDEIIAQESRQGRRRQDQSEGDRLVRRSGDEGVRRQSEPANGQRAAQEEARALRRARIARAACPVQHKTRDLAAAAENFRARGSLDRESLAPDSLVFDQFRHSARRFRAVL